MIKILGDRHPMHPSTRAANGSQLEGAVTEDHHDRSTPAPSPVVRNVVTWLAITGVFISVPTFAWPLYRALWQQQPWMIQIISSHFAAVVGLPGAALVAFLLVVLLEARFDKVEMEFGGLVSFRGASGPIVLWILCFLAITVATKMLW